MIESVLRKILWVRRYLFENPPYRIFRRRFCGPPPPNYVAPPAATLHRLTQSLTSPVGETRVPQGWSAVSERHAQALLPSCPPPTPTPVANSDPSIASSTPNDPSYTCPARRQESMLGVSNLEKKTSDQPSGNILEYSKKPSVPRALSTHGVSSLEKKHRTSRAGILEYSKKPSVPDSGCSANRSR
jgi:hypothetical protein